LCVGSGIRLVLFRCSSVCRGVCGGRWDRGCVCGGIVTFPAEVCVIRSGGCGSVCASVITGAIWCRCGACAICGGCGRIRCVRSRCVIGCISGVLGGVLGGGGVLTLYLLSHLAHVHTNRYHKK